MSKDGDASPPTVPARVSIEQLVALSVHKVANNAEASQTPQYNPASEASVSLLPSSLQALTPGRRDFGPFRHVALLLMFNFAEHLGNLPVLEHWYAPHFDRIVAYCDIPGHMTSAEVASAAVARGTPAEVIARVTFVHAGAGLAIEGGLTRSDIGGGSFSQIVLAHYFSRLRKAGEFTNSSSGGLLAGVFLLGDDALLSPRLLSRLDINLPLVGFFHEGGRRIDVVGRGRDRSWSWWHTNEGQPRMRSAMADPALREFAPAGDVAQVEWVGGYSDYVYIPRRFIADGRLQRCLELLGWHGVYFEIAIPTCSHLCVLPVPEASLAYQDHGHVILWGDERRVIDAAFVESSLRTNLITHPVKLGRLSAADRERVDIAMTG